MGDVAVPAGKRLLLGVGSATVNNLSALSELKPDDLYALHIFGYDTVDHRGGAKPDDQCMQHLRNLSGLQVLSLWDTDITHKGLRFITDMQSLKSLSIVQAGKLGDAGLAQLAKVKSLEDLKLGACDRITHAGLRHLSKLTSLRELHLWGEDSRIRGPGLVHLANMPSLRSLNLRGNKGIGDAELKYLEKATSLRKLDLSGLPITGEGLTHLSHLTELEELNLYGTNMSDKGLVYLKSMHSLKKLTLRNRPGAPAEITDAGMAHLGQIKSLESLNLPSGITDKGLSHLADLNKLTFLWVCCSTGSILTDEGLAHLANLSSLEELHIAGRGFTDAGMSHLAKLTHLEHLDLYYCPISDQGLAKLATLKSLKSLTIKRQKITISGLFCLNVLPDLTVLDVSPVIQDNTGLNIAGLTKLETLRIGTEKGSGTAIRDEDLACLAKLTHLKTLETPQSSRHRRAISDIGMAYLTDLTALETLWIGGPGITDKGLSYLANMKHMTNLNITGDITEQGLKHLDGLTHLKRLRVYSTNKFGDKAVQRLRKTLPIIRIFDVKKSEDVKKLPRVGDKAPPFALQTLDGKEIKLKNYRGKVVLLYFWATWCTPCIASTPAIKELHEVMSRHEKFAMISLSMDDTEPPIRRHLEKYKLPWPQVHLGRRSQVAADYGVTGAPAYCVIGPDGKIVFMASNWQKLRNALTQAPGLAGN